MRFLLVPLLLLVAAPLAAQSNPICTQSRTSALVSKVVTFSPADSGTLITTYVSRDSQVDTCTKVQRMAKGSGVVPPKPDTVRPPVDTTRPPQPPVAGKYPNRPANFTRIVSERDFTDAVPACGGERVLPSRWTVIFDCVGSSSNFTAASEDGRSTWRLRQQAGVFGGGVPGAGEGKGFGNTGYPLGSVNAVYLSLWVKHDSLYESHPGSTKFLELEGLGNCLIQYRWNDTYLRPSCEGIGQAYPPQVLAEPTRGAWHQIEAVVIAGTPGTMRVWVDGKIRVDHTTLPVRGPFTAFKVVGHLGGGGMTKVRDSFYWLDHVFIATVP